VNFTIQSHLAKITLCTGTRCLEKEFALHHTHTLHPNSNTCKAK